MVFHTETCRSCSDVNFNANLKLFLRLSNCASVGEKNFDDCQEARYVRGKKKKSDKLTLNFIIVTCIKCAKIFTYKKTANNYVRRI